MNIELLNEIKKSLKSGMSLTDISTELSLQKSTISLMLRMEKILENQYILKLHDLNEELSILKVDLENCLNDNQLLRTEINKHKHDHPFVKFPLISNYQSSLESDIHFLKLENSDLLNKIEDLEYSLSRIPIFVKKIFIEDERY